MWFSIAEDIEHLLNDSAILSAIQIFMYARDHVLFQSLVLAGDRVADLLQLKCLMSLLFPDDSGFLFNHIWTKFFRSGDCYVFAF